MTRFRLAFRLAVAPASAALLTGGVVLAVGAALSGRTAPFSEIAQSATPSGPAGDVLLSRFMYDDAYPRVAFNGHAREFLVVWDHLGNIYGQRYSLQGVPQGEDFPISTAFDLQSRPAVAYSLASDSFLVVWEDGRGEDYDIYGQLVDSDGTLLDNPTTPEVERSPELAFVILSDTGDQQLADLDFDGNSYLVAWQGRCLGATDSVCGRFVGDDGTVERTVFPLAETNDVPREEPAVAYNPTEGEYLVVFRFGEADAAEIHGRRVHPAGTLSGGEFTIARQPGAGAPRVASSAVGSWVVVWSEARTGIFGQVVLAGADASFDGDRFPISTQGTYCTHPAIALSPTTGEFLVVWIDDRTAATSGMDVYAQRLLPDANPVGPNFPVCTVAGEQTSPAVVASQAPDSYFVTWDDLRTRSFDVYGQRVARTGSLLGYEFEG